MPRKPKKDSGIAALIALIGGLFGICGLGHIYVGKLARGLVILFAQILLLTVGILLTITIIGSIIGIPLLIVYAIIWIWQIFDASKLAKEYK
jgi:TM2 domain-containing membrane protein YozV